MKLSSTVSTILCTALLASFCNAFPYPDYWDREVFLDHLQQEERVGTDIKARIEQGDESCPDPSTSDEFHHKEHTLKFVIMKRNTSETFEYKCEAAYTLIIGAGGIKLSPTPSITYECSYESSVKSYKPSIKKTGQPRCLLFFCESLPQIQNGGVRYDGQAYNSKYKPGTNATYFCDTQYDLIGAEKRTCDISETWTGEEPTCKSIEVMCPALPSIPNGAVTFANRTPGAIANYSCRFGYRLNGTKERICGLDGNWSRVEPSCEVIICHLENLYIPNGEAAPSRSPIVVPGPGGGLGFPVDTVVNYTCDKGFELQGESIRICLESGEWNPPEPPSCAPTPKCHELKESDIPNNVPEAKKQLRHHWDYENLLFTPYYNRRIEGDRSVGSKAYLTCLRVSKNDGWKLLEGTPDEQTCVRSENGTLVWTEAGTCVFKYSYTRPRPSYG